MEVPGRVAAWEPPRRIVFDGGEGVGGLAFEWLVEAREGGTCIVRLVNSGFGSGADWDDQYDAMTGGWKMFLGNLRLHLTHFAGQSATTSLPGAVEPGPAPAAWSKLCADLGISSTAVVGERLEIAATGAPALAGVVAEGTPTRFTLVVDDPLPGTAIIAAEAISDITSLSVWTYLYGADAPGIGERDEALWQSWLDART